MSDHDNQLCSRCGNPFEDRSGDHDEPGLCDLCAQEMVVELRAKLAASEAALKEAKEGEAYSDAKLTEHAEAVGVNPDHIDYIEETTKAIIAMWANNSRLEAQVKEQLRLYCEETKKHNATSADLTAALAREAALREALKRALVAINANFGKAQRDHIIAQGNQALAAQEAKSE